MFSKLKLKLKRKAKDSVFTKLFGKPEYAIQLYKVFHPEDTTSTEKELKIITLENVLVDGEYNDLGILLNNRLMLFVEAQSTWNSNMPIRILLYIAETYKRYLMEKKINLLKNGHVTIPTPEAYVIFTGERDEKPTEMKLSEHFPVKNKKFEFKENSLELKVKMIYNSDEGDIVYQYINFCKVLDEQKKSYHDDDDKIINETMRICEKRNLLADYIEEHRPEVYKSMSDYLSNQRLLTKWYIEDEKKAAREAGRAEGHAEGLAKGVHDAKLETARNLLAEGIPTDVIAKCTSLTLEEVTKLQAEMTATA